MSAASADGSLRVICGPTGAGKSALALALATRYRGAIVSADSQQVYRGFDVGTAKPTASDRELVPHWGIDVCGPEQRYSAAAWAGDATHWIEQIVASGRTPLVVGGTGLYLRALFGPLFEEPPLDPCRRDALARYLGALPVSQLRAWCAALDDPRAHLGRTQLLRAIEIALLTGHRLSTLHRERARPPRWRARYLLIDPGPALAGRLVQRVDAMLAAGWMEEVQRLARQVPPDAPAWKATGYRVLREVAEGRESMERGRERVIVETRQYAKRQRTWFRHQLPPDRVTRLDATALDWEATAERWWWQEVEA